MGIFSRSEQVRFEQKVAFRVVGIFPLETVITLDRISEQMSVVGYLNYNSMIDS